MSTLREASQKYLELRRNLGFQLRGPRSALRSFVAFAEREDASSITTDLALRWAQEPAQAQPVTWASRLRMVRCFAVWLSATDRRTEVPPVGILPYRYRPAPPETYTLPLHHPLPISACRRSDRPGLLQNLMSS